MDELMTCVQGPDFPTGGILMGKSGIRAAYATGKGKLTLRGQTHFEKVRGRQAIIVTEIPYMVNKARLVKSIADLARISGSRAFPTFRTNPAVRACGSLSN